MCIGCMHRVDFSAADISYLRFSKWFQSLILIWIIQMFIYMYIHTLRKELIDWWNDYMYFYFVDVWQYFGFSYFRLASDVNKKTANWNRKYCTVFCSSLTLLYYSAESDSNLERISWVAWTAFPTGQNPELWHKVAEKAPTITEVH